MAIVEMKKLAIIGLKEEKNAIIKKIQRFGLVEISEQTEEKIDAQQLRLEFDEAMVSSIENRFAEVRAAIDLLRPWSDVKRGMFTPKKEMSLTAMDAFMENAFDVEETLRSCKIITEALALCRTAETRLNSAVEQVSPWVELDLAVEQIGATAETLSAIGMVSDIEEEAELPSGVAMHLVKQEGDTRFVLMIYHKDVETEARRWLKDVRFDPVTFQNMKGTPREILGGLETERSENQQQRLAAEAQLKLLAVNIEMLEIYYDGLSIERERAIAASRLLGTNATFMIKGWIPAEHIESFKASLSAVTNDYYAWFEEPEEGEAFPVLLDNPTVVQPFEMVTNLYSVPSSRGLDPNRVMAPFYFLFFGMMLSDAGYGIILALAGMLFAKKLKVRPGDREGMGRLIWLIAIGGISTFVWGAFFGSWFGDISVLTGGWKLNPLGFDPQAEPITMLALCFGLGIIHLFVGMGMDAYKSIKKGRVLDAVLDQGLWYVLIVGLILLAIPQTSAVGKLLSIGGTVGLIATQGRKQQGLFKKLFSGVGSLYNLTGYLSDVLSYSRLFALGLATGVIATVINQLGAMLGTSVVGYIFMAVLLAGGHVFNMVINVLGSFVHASRLQYIEFFGKFFEGGGHAFNPLRIKTKFVNINEREAH